MIFSQFQECRSTQLKPIGHFVFLLARSFRALIFCLYGKKTRVRVKTACKNSFSVLRKVEKRTEFNQIFSKPNCPIAKVESLILEP